MDPATPVTPKPQALPKFARFELRQLLGKSAATTAWLAFDPAMGEELVLVLPRAQPSGGAALQSWLARVKKAARLNHPNLCPLLDVGVQDSWPFVTVERRYGVTLGEWLAAHPASTPAEMVDIMIQALQGLAYVHDAGMGHDDVQLHSLLLNEQGQARWMALGAASGTASNKTSIKGNEAAPGANTADLQQVHRQRHQAERDLIGCGLLMYRWLAAHPAFDEADFGAAMNRLTPWGHEILRLPFNSTQNVPEALRAIVNRCLANQERQRYRSARTLLRALDGWRQAQAMESGGPLSLLMDRINQVGHLPAQPGLAARVAGMTSIEGQHAEGMASQVLLDVALCLELLRSSNSGQLREAAGSGDGPILAIRRCIALLGVDGVRRAANSLRLWPGPLQPAQAGMMQRLIDRVRLAAYAGQALRPAGYDPEVVFLVVVLQNLGRLLVQYHFPDEAEQIEQLMRPTLASAGSEGAAAELPGLSEEVASNTVLGVDLDTLRSAVVRQWGLGEDLVQMIRPLPLDKPVRTPGSDAEILRATASAANELVAASDIQPPQRCAEALTHLASRYARVLKVNLADLRETLLNARAAVRDGIAVAQTNRTADAAESVDTAAAGLRG